MTSDLVQPLRHFAKQQLVGVDDVLAIVDSVTGNELSELSTWYLLTNVPADVSVGLFVFLRIFDFGAPIHFDLCQIAHLKTTLGKPCPDY